MSIIGESYLIKLAIHNYSQPLTRTNKTASSARAFRLIASLAKKGLKGSSLPANLNNAKLLERTTGKLQSTAERQIGLTNKHELGRIAINNWNRTGRSATDLGMRQKRTQTYATDMANWKKHLSEFINLPFWQRLFNSRRTLQSTQDKALTNIMAAYKHLKSTGIDIGRFLGKIPATTKPTPTPFDPMDQLYSSVVRTTKTKPHAIDLTEEFLPGLKALQQKITPAVSPLESVTPSAPSIIGSSPAKPQNSLSTTPLVR